MKATPDGMNITVVGAGNVGTQFAVHCAKKRHPVTIYSSKPEQINKELTIVGENNKMLHTGTIQCATNDARLAFENADIIFITTPAFGIGEMAQKILPYAKKDVKIGLIPGTGGGECAFRSGIERGITVFGLQRVPSVARLVEYGKTVRAVGYRDELHAAAMPGKKTEECCRIVEALFDRKCTPLPSYLNLTLTPSNPILHPTRLRMLYKNYREGTIYDRVPLFYEEWDDETSELLLKCDEEVQELCKRLDNFDLTFVKSLRAHYESYTVEAMTRKISSIKGFKGIASPVVKVEGGYIPDLNSRYFTADFPYGLAILVQIADFYSMDVPNMKETLAWYYDLTGSKRSFQYSDYGIVTKEDFVRFYST